MSKVNKIIWGIALVAVLVMIGMVVFGYIQKATFQEKNPVATMEVENFGTVKIELYPDQAPQSVANFIALANRGFYDDLTFHRIVKDFMIQGGDKEGTGKGSAKISNIRDLKKDDQGKETETDREYVIKGEFISNGVNNTLKMTEGVLAMARSTLNDSASSQFFIVTKDTDSINGQYAGFGKVIEGMDVVHKIEGVEVKAAEGEKDSGTSQEISTPVNAPKIKSIRVDTFGVDYGLPELLDYNQILYKQYGIDPSSTGSTIIE